MKVNVIFFGVLAEVANTSLKSYNDIRTFEDFEARLKEDFPEIVNYNYRVAVNQELVNGSPLLKDNDEILLIPPFEGG